MHDLRPVYYHENRDRLDGNRLVVYNALLHHGRATAREIAHSLNWDVTSVRPRLTELKKAGLVDTTGGRRNGEHEFTTTSVTSNDRCRSFSLEYCHA